MNIKFSNINEDKVVSLLHYAEIKHEFRSSDFSIFTDKNWPKYFSQYPKNMNLENNIYIYVTRGFMGTTGFDIRVISIIDTGELIKVNLHLKNPGEGQQVPVAAFTMVTLPRAMVEINKSELPQKNKLTFVFIEQNGEELRRITINP